MFIANTVYVNLNIVAIFTVTVGHFEASLEVKIWVCYTPLLNLKAKIKCIFRLMYFSPSGLKWLLVNLKVCIVFRSGHGYIVPIQTQYQPVLMWACVLCMHEGISH